MKTHSTIMRVSPTEGDAPLLLRLAKVRPLDGRQVKTANSDSGASDAEHDVVRQYGHVQRYAGRVRRATLISEGSAYAILTRVWPHFHGKLHRDRTRVKGVGSNRCYRRYIEWQTSCLRVSSRNKGWVKR